MIIAVSWVPKGASKTVPDAAELPSKEEIQELARTGALHPRDDDVGDDDGGMDVDATSPENEDAAARALAVAKALTDKGSSSIGDLDCALQELDMDRYDEEDDDGIELFSKGMGDLYYASNKMDPYLISKDDDDDDDDEEIEDMTIKPTDAVIVCARTVDEVSQLEVMIFEESEDGDSYMFVHHEIILSSFPLCTAWLDCKPKSGDKGNFIAVGSMEPEIEIWDLDVLEEVKPFAVLGGKKKKKGKKTSVTDKEGHKNSVLGLAWNTEVRNVLASGSADKSVKVWDLVKRKCVVTMKHHTDKVQAVSWNKHSPEMLLSGSFDKTVVLMDVRSDAHVGNRWSVPADVECLAWNPHTEYSFVASLDNGMVQGFDVRAASSDSSCGSKPSFTLHAHEEAVSAISFNSVAPNLLATGSTDKMVKLWDISNNHPICVASRNPKIGDIFSLSFSADSPSLLALGGLKGKIEVWDTLCDSNVEHHFGKYMKQRK